MSKYNKLTKTLNKHIKNKKVISINIEEDIIDIEFDNAKHLICFTQTIMIGENEEESLPTKWLATLIRTEQKKLLAEIGEPKLEDAINEEKTPEGVKSTPKEPNDIFIILSPYFECKDCGELGCPYNPDVPAELAEAIDQYTQTMCERARQDELKQLWNSTQPDIVPDGVEANDMSEALHKRIEKQIKKLSRSITDTVHDTMDE